MESAPKQFDVGIIGAGQLARMMVQSAISLGISIRILAESPADSAALVWPDVVIGSPDDPGTVAHFARDCRVVTFDHELVPPIVLAQFEPEQTIIRPSAQTLEFAQNKRWQRAELSRLGFPIPPFQFVESVEDITKLASATGWPVAVKIATGGYDGRGVWRVESAEEASKLFYTLSNEKRDLLAEAWLPIEREIAVIVAQNDKSGTRTYPIVDTVQIDGICREIVAPAVISDRLSMQAGCLAIDAAVEMRLDGVMAVEFFVVNDELLINEVATRPHNSGHYTIEGCATSQFEQHLRAVLDLPLGSTDLTAKHVVTVNVLGGPSGEDPRTRLQRALSVPGIHVHLYGKQARPGRKLGHVTTLGDDLPEVRERAWKAASILTGERMESPR